ncbi:conserved hypothetical protein [Ancylobacter novellus DSM 506]|uniref:Uncharacterized protein n=1 Tax=Ancylobacter novellus (strain ATCC 8093 / DSM 506 / JCM 20403 / CCM 1077 / IAM 12100 / NBRC 12443 / NCIMB 10456) TaxID=639283 RepID=D6ZZR8_ANCN5|nr:hypothetical protein [Ancylobacter novellus]ADH91263.1 conserved hypothetical protein [Ancylobacter novellus DSM 506]
MKHMLTPLAAALLLGFAPAANASPCADAVTKAQSELDQYIDALAAAGPSAPETTGALLSHDPSPGEIARTEAELGDGDQAEQAQEALDRARAAEANGDTATCEAEVARARATIGRK